MAWLGAHRLTGWLSVEAHVVDRVTLIKRPHPQPRTSEYVTLHGKGTLQIDSIGDLEIIRNHLRGPNVIIRVLTREREAGKSEKEMRSQWRRSK